jgi:hypothetical protein
MLFMFSYPAFQKTVRGIGKDRRVSGCAHASEQTYVLIHTFSRRSVAHPSIAVFFVLSIYERVPHYVRTHKEYFLLPGLPLLSPN